MKDGDFQFALADSIASLNPAHWDQVVEESGRFLSRRYLGLLEQNLPENLATHYGIITSASRPVTAVVAQSLDIGAATLSSRPLPVDSPGIWNAVGKASQRSLARARRQVLLYDNLLPGPCQGEVASAEVQAGGELWPKIATDLWHRSRQFFKAAEGLAERSMGWVHLRFLVCGNLLSTGPHGIAFAPGEDPVRLWPAVIEAIGRIRKSSAQSGAMDMVMFKDLAAGQEAGEDAVDAVEMLFI